MKKLSSSLERKFMEQKIPLELPLLNRYISNFGSEKIFDDVNIIFAQHFLGDFVPLVKAVKQMGGKKDLCWFLDIPYAVNEIIRKEIIKLGFDRENFAPDVALGALDSYESTQYFRTIELFKKAIANGIERGARRTIILDDGGHSALARFVIEKFALEKKHPVVVVEQTGHGIRLHRQYGLVDKVKIINVSNCAAKVKYETPVVANTCMLELRELLQREGIELDPTDRFLIMGYGTVGKAIVESLNHELSIPLNMITIKPDPIEKYFVLENDTLSEILTKNIIGSHKIVIGCSGDRAFHNSHLSLLKKDAILVSVSSWSLEFPKDDWVVAAESPRLRNVKLLNTNIETLATTIHEPLRFALNGQRIILANAGYPINFWGGVNTSPPEFMQLTVTLMVDGAVESVTTDLTNGEISLNQDNEHWIIDSYQAVLNEQEPVVYI